jgi:hypothetical protein
MQANQHEGLGCSPVPEGTDPQLAAEVYKALRYGSPRLAFAQACGVPLVPFSIRVVGDFPDVAQALSPSDGNTIKIVQDTFISEIKFQVQNQNPPSGLDSLTNFFFELESGIEARLKTIAGGTGYNPVPDFTPIKLISRRLVDEQSGPWLLTYDNGLVMDFQATVLPLPFPVKVTFVFEGKTSYFPKIIDMSQLQAVKMLKEMGYLCDAYMKMYC